MPETAEGEFTSDIVDDNMHIGALLHMDASADCFEFWSVVYKVSQKDYTFFPPKIILGPMIRDKNVLGKYTIFLQTTCIFYFIVDWSLSNS